MEPWLIALLVKPFILLAGWVVFCYPALRLVHRMKDGKIKRLLLRPVGQKSAARQGR